MSDDELESRLVNHVPDEVCVRVRAPQPADPAALYEQVRETLNASLAGVLASPPPAQTAAPLEQDLAPLELARRFGAGSPVLEPLERRRLSARGPATGVRPPWFSQPDGADATAWHFYYAIGGDRVDFASAQRAERLRRLAGVRELVNLLNRHLAQLGPALADGDGWSLLGGAPNWLTVAAPFGCGCPAGLPVAEPRRGRWRFGFAAAVQQALAGPPAEQTQVVVAILDTCPRLPPGADRGNPALAELIETITVHPAGQDATLGWPADYFTAPPGTDHYLDSCLPWWHDALPADRAAAPEFAVPDHGLFVAGIIHGIAPQAEIHLIRVLDDYGMGDALALGQVLHSLPDALLRGDPRRRLIVNLSLGTTVPVPPRRHWARWLPRTHAAAAGARPQPDATSQHLLEAAHASLWSTLHWLHDQGVLVVAAAGNDALRPQTHEGTPPPPRYPARYQEVLAVAAANAVGAPASYSNRADVRPLGNGIASFGGEVVPAGRTSPPLTATAAAADGRNAALVGVYSADRFPDGSPNLTGWAQWAGTSFSTPIVSGVAAGLWARDGQLQPTGLMQQLRGFAQPMTSGPAPDPDPDGPLDAPLLDAWQDYQPEAPTP